MTTVTTHDQRAKLVTYLRTRATITTDARPESESVRGNALDSGDPAMDTQEEDRIIDDLDNGNQWAWFVAHVQARFAGLVGEDFLGSCSYASREDFEAPGGYHADMVAAALDELAHAIIADADTWAAMLPLLETRTRDADTVPALEEAIELATFAKLVLKEMDDRGHGSKDPGRSPLADGLARDGFRLLAKEARKRGLL